MPRVGGGPVPGGGDVLDEPVDLRFREVGCRGRQHPCVGGELAAVGGDGQGVVDPRVHLLRPQPLVAFDQLPAGGRAAPRTSGRRRRWACRLSRRGRGRSSISAVCTSEKARNICWSSGRLVKRAKRLRGRSDAPVRRDFHRVDDFAEGGRPGVEMLQAAAPQPLGVEESLHRVHLDHRVAEIGVPVAKVTPWPACCSCR